MKGPEPLASPNVLHWVGWLPGTERCATLRIPPLARRFGGAAREGEASERPFAPMVGECLLV